MRKRVIVSLLATVFVMTCLLAGCGDAPTSEDLENYRELSWEGTELTISLGENKSTGCNWSTKPQDDKVIDYSVNRVFHMSDASGTEGQAIGILDAGFEGKGAGTTTIVCTTPVNWDGTGEGYTYTVTVTVNEDGTIENAVGE
jgi:predicted secreted protein